MKNTRERGEGRKRKREREGEDKDSKKAKKRARLSGFLTDSGEFPRRCDARWAGHVEERAGRLITLTLSVTRTSVNFGSALYSFCGLRLHQPDIGGVYSALSQNNKTKQLIQAISPRAGPSSSKLG